jgi:DNA-binding transcriptional MocR family regulator
MDPAIDLRLNYPVLPSQTSDFKTSFTRHFNAYDHWLSIKPFRGNDTDQDTAAAWLSRGGETIHRDRVSVTTGGHHGLLVSLLAAGLRGKVVVTDEYTYPNFKEMAGLLGIQLVACAGDEKGMLPETLKEVAAKFSTGKSSAGKSPAGGIYLMPTLHNPMGYVMPVERRLAIIAVAHSLGLVIIEDDAYGFLEDNPPSKFAQLEPALCWYICSMAKPIAPDIKVGYVVSPLKDIPAISTAIKLSTSNPSSFFSAYISALIGSGELDRIIREKRQEGRKRREAAQRLLAGYNARGHENGWHLWVELPAGINSDDLNAAVTKQGVLLSPASAYRTGEKNNGRDFFRIALAGEQDFDRVRQGIELITGTLRQNS